MSSYKRQNICRVSQFSYIHVKCRVLKKYILKILKKMCFQRIVHVTKILGKKINSWDIYVSTYSLEVYLHDVYRKDRKFSITWSSYQGSCLYANRIAQNESAACSSVVWCEAREYSLPDTITQPTFSASAGMSYVWMCVSRNVFTF